MLADGSHLSNKYIDKILFLYRLAWCLANLNSPTGSTSPSCPTEAVICAAEVRLLTWLDRGRGQIRFEDITDPEFVPQSYGLSQETVMARIHGVLPDGRVIEGMEVLRCAYEAVNLGWLLAPTRWPGLRGLSDAAYRLFARYRLRLTGRSGARSC